MLDDIGYCIKIKHGTLKILHGEVIIDKGSKICGLSILKGSNVVVHSSTTNEDFYYKNKLWNLRSRHYICLEVVSSNLMSFT